MANGFETFLSKAGKDIKGVFAWLGSTQGQQAIAGGEAAASVAAGLVGGPGLAATVSGVEALINSGLKNVITTEALAAAAGQQSGTGTQKAALVVGALAPDAGAFLKAIGVNDATAAEVQALATAFGNAGAAILNAIPARAAVTPNAA